MQIFEDFICIFGSRFLCGCCNSPSRRCALPRRVAPGAGVPRSCPGSRSCPWAVGRGLWATSLPAVLVLSAGCGTWALGHFTACGPGPWAGWCRHRVARLPGTAARGFGDGCQTVPGWGTGGFVPVVPLSVLRSRQVVSHHNALTASAAIARSKYIGNTQ